MASSNNSRFFEQIPPAAGSHSRTRARTSFPSDDIYTTPPQPSQRPRFTTPDYGTPQTTPNHRNDLRQVSPTIPFQTEERTDPDADVHRDSDVTLLNQPSVYNFSSYQHPYDIQPPSSAYAPQYQPAEYTQSRHEGNQLHGSPVRRSVSFADEPRICQISPSSSYSQITDANEGQDEGSYWPEVGQSDVESERALKRRGIPSNMLHLQRLQDQDDDPTAKKGRAQSDMLGPRAARPKFRRADSNMSNGSLVIDEYDPRITGVEAKQLEDRDDIERNILRQMDYRSRRKYQQRSRIEFNVTCVFVTLFVWVHG